MFRYESEGSTRASRPSQRANVTSNQHFFAQLGQRIIKVVTQLGPYGRLYELDPRLRPTGRSGSLTWSLEELRRYFAEGQGQLWERQALCKARPICGSAAAQQATLATVHGCIVDLPWQPANALEIRQMRQRLEDTASKRNLKRGPGGTVDIEFAVQMLQLRHAAHSPSVLTPSTLDALLALRDVGHISVEAAECWRESDRCLGSIE